MYPYTFIKASHLKIVDPNMKVEQRTLDLITTKI